MDTPKPKKPTRGQMDTWAKTKLEEKLKKVAKEKTLSKATSKPKTSAKPLTGEAAAKALQKRTSPKGVKEFEKRASKALDKKYPGLYKKTKGMK